jgi:hypothetical protein
MNATLTLNASSFFSIVASPSSKISNPQDASFLCPSAVPSCSSAMIGKIKY